jgi:hypothetical protein
VCIYHGDPDPQQLILGRKFNINIDFDGYKAYRSARGRPPPTPPSSNSAQAPLDGPQFPSGDDAAGGVLSSPGNASEPPAPYPTSFAHIVELITSGQPVPGIKDVPSTILTGQATEPTKPRRKKPWEKDEAAVAT